MICQTFVYPSNHIKCFLNHKNQTILLYKLNEIFVNLKNKNIQILKKKAKKCAISTSALHLRHLQIKS